MLHVAIEKWHWSPSKIEEWVEADQNIKALYYASISVKAEHDRKEAAKMKAKNHGKKR